MIYLTRMLGEPVLDAAGERIGTISDIAIATGEVFPRVTSLAFKGPDKTPFMLSWRKYVEGMEEDQVVLNAPRSALRFSYLQPDEVLLARDLLDKQIVDTQGMKVVRVNDLKLAESKNQLRLLGAEVGLRGVLRGISPALERVAAAAARVFGRELSEKLIAWNYMDLLDRDLSQVKLSVTHKRLHELHPADVADILEQLSANQRAKVFAHLDNEQAAEAISEMEDELQAEVLDDLASQRASDILEEMDPDDAADIIGDLPYDKAEKLLRLMGLEEQREIRSLLGYRENTAGGIMTPEVTTVTEDMTVGEVIEHLRGEAGENESIFYIYVVDEDRTLTGVISLRDLILAQPDTAISELVERDVLTVGVDDDQEDVAEKMSKYDLLAMPVIDETGRILGIVTVDDALEVMEEESAEDLALATGTLRRFESGTWSWIGSKTAWATVWVVLGVLTAAALWAFSSTISTFVASVLFIPLVFRLTEDISSHSLSMLIEAGAERESLGRQVVIDLAVGVGLGLVSGLVAFAMLQVLRQPLSSAVVLSLAVAGTIVLMALAGAVVPWVVIRRGGAGFRATSTIITVGLAAVGLVVYLGLTVALRAVVRL